MSFETPFESDAEYVSSAGLRTVLGLLFILPGCLVWSLIQLLPAISSVQTSYTNANILRPSPNGAEFVGMENYVRLFEDPQFSGAMTFTLSFLILRLVIVAVVPPLVGLTAGMGNRGMRLVTRVFLSIATVLTVPIGLAVLWRLMTNPNTDVGRQFEGLMLNQPESARFSLLLVDSIITLLIALAVGAAAFMAVSRGRSLKSNFAPTAWVLWGLGLLLTLASLPLTFQLPWILTQGGPGNSTLTLPMLGYQQSFVFLRMGAGAAIGTMMIVGAVLLAVVVWLLLLLSRLRIRFAPPTEGGSGLSVLGLLLALGGLLPILSVFVLSVSAVNSFPGGSRASEAALGFAPALINTTLTPWVAVWLIQVPLAYLIGLALGFLRPIHRIVAEFLFLGFLIIAFMPKQALALPWFMSGREAGVLNTPVITIMGSVVSVFGLIVFKLYFDGVFEQLAVQRQTGENVTFWSKAFLPSLGVAALVGVVGSFTAMLNVYIPLVSTNSVELYNVPLLLVFTMSSFATEWGTILNLVFNFIGVIVLIFLPAFLALHIFLLDRLAIVSGASPSVKRAPAPEPESSAEFDDPFADIP